MRKHICLKAYVNLICIILLVMPFSNAQAQISEEQANAKIVPILYLLLFDEDDRPEPPRNNPPTGSFSSPTAGISL